MKEIDKNELETLRRKAENNVKDVVSGNRKRRAVKTQSNSESEKKNQIDNYNIKFDTNDMDSDDGEYKINDNFKRNNINEKKVKSEKKNRKKTKKEKEPFSFKKLLLKIFICLVIATFLTIILFYMLDRFLYNIDNVSMLDKPVTGLQKQDNVKEGIKIEEGMNSIQFSYNNKYYTYLKDGKVYIKDLSTNSDVATVENDKEICYYTLLYDKNLIFYVTREDSDYSTYLQIFTYEISSGKTAEYNEFNVSGFTKIKDLEYSPVVNIIYLNVERESGEYIDNIVYRIDLFNNMGRYATNIIVDKMVMRKFVDSLYFEDGSGINYYEGYVLRIFDEGVDLIGVDLNDNTYFISSDRKTVYIVSGRTITNTIDLTDTNLITWYSDNTNVYLIYPGYVLNISTTTPLKQIAKMSKYVTFLTIKSNTMYLKTMDNRIIWTKIDVK